jgi:hypothetical protein
LGLLFQSATCANQQDNLMASLTQTQGSEQSLSLTTSPTPLRINLQDTHLY